MAAASDYGDGGACRILPAIDAAKASGMEALNFLATPLFSVPGSQCLGSRCANSFKLAFNRRKKMYLPAMRLGIAEEVMRMLEVVEQKVAGVAMGP
jgi:hypothetical protein